MRASGEQLTKSELHGMCDAGRGRVQLQLSRPQCLCNVWTQDASSPRCPCLTPHYLGRA